MFLGADGGKLTPVASFDALGRVLLRIRGGCIPHTWRCRYDLSVLRPAGDFTLCNNQGFAIPGLATIKVRPSVNIGACKDYALNNRHINGTFSDGGSFKFALDNKDQTFATAASVSTSTLLPASLATSPTNCPLR